MHGQHALPISVPHKLTDRQQLALDLLREHGPLNGREWGRLVHAAQSKHSPERFCSYCESAGVELGKVLRGKEYVKRRNRNTRGLPSGWYAVVPGTGRAWREAVGEDVDWGGFGE